MRVETVDDLTARLKAFFGKAGVALEQMSGMSDYGVAFTVPSDFEFLVKGLKAQTDSSLWSGETTFLVYRNDEENFVLTLQSASFVAHCTATVISLHDKHLEKNDAKDCVSQSDAGYDTGMESEQGGTETVMLIKAFSYFLMSCLTFAAAVFSFRYNAIAALWCGGGALAVGLIGKILSSAVE